VGLCNDRQRCQVPVSHDIFTEDPCPNIGKYLEVAYRCKPGIRRIHWRADSVIACMDKALRFTHIWSWKNSERPPPCTENKVIGNKKISTLISALPYAPD